MAQPPTNLWDFDEGGPLPHMVPLCFGDDPQDEYLAAHLMEELFRTAGMAMEIAEVGCDELGDREDGYELLWGLLTPADLTSLYNDTFEALWTVLRFAASTRGLTPCAYLDGSGYGAVESHIGMITTIVWAVADFLAQEIVAGRFRLLETTTGCTSD